ncbi:DMT family transporter [Rhodobacteraceae bacterium NNCM2]|nr:DMT family transporter [Coraliihabitans acroporae]
MTSSTTGIRFALLAMLCFAAQDGVSKHLAASYPVPFFVMLRYWAFAVFVILLASRQPGGLRAAVKTKMPVLQVIRGVMLVMQILVFVYALDLLGLAPMMALFALYPLLITVLAIPILGERVGWRRFMAVGIGFAGVLVILRPGLSVFDPNALVALLAAFGIALYSIFTRIVTRADERSSPAMFYTGVVGAITITVIGPFYWVPMAPADWGWMALLAVAGMAGHSFLIRAYEASEAVRIQPFTYLQMVFGVIIGWTIFGEMIDPWMVVGMAMIIGAGLYALWREMRVAT